MAKPTESIPHIATLNKGLLDLASPLKVLARQGNPWPRHIHGEELQPTLDF